MSTSSAASLPSLPAAPRARTLPIIDGHFAKWFAILCGIVPGLLLLWDAYRGNLGVNAVNYAIRSTGMIGLVLLTLSLVITPVRRLTKWNWLLSARRNIGVYGFAYIAAHFLIFFVWDRALDVGSTLEEIVTRVYLWFGMGALVLMIPLALTSTDGMVTRLGPKRWKLLHRLAYLAVLGGVVHFYLLVKADTTRPFVFAVLLGGLMLYRVVAYQVDLYGELAQLKAKKKAPGAGGPKKKKFWSGELRVARIFQETHDVRTFRFVATDGGPLPFDYIAGQYLNLALTIQGVRVNRSYTIASTPTRPDAVEITVKRAAAGYVSHHMHDTVKEGDVLKVSAPAGKFYFAGAPTDAKRVVLVAGGVGITPMMSIVRSLTDRAWPGDMYLLFVVRKRHDIIFEQEIEYLRARFPNLHVCLTLSNHPEAEWSGKRGRLTRELVEGFVPELRGAPILMCGPEPMMEATRALLVSMGVPNADIMEEAFVSPPTVTPSAAAGVVAAVVEDIAMPGEVANVRFAKADVTAELTPGLTVLEAAEECGVEIPFECRSGICGQCKTKLVSGRVTMESQDALTAGDRAKGLILACQAKAVKDIVVDA